MVRSSKAMAERRAARLSPSPEQTNRHWLVIGLMVSQLAVVLLGCKAAPQVSSARELYYHGNLADSRTAFQNAGQSGPGSNVLRDLNLAMVELAAGKPIDAQRRFLKARDSLDAQQGPDLVGGTLSAITDDRARQYKGWGYERVMLQAMLAIDSLMNDAFDAHAYALQTQNLQSTLQRECQEAGFLEAGKAYQPLALAPYIRGMLAETSHHDYDDALRAYQQVAEFRPDFAPAPFDLERARSGVHSQPGHGALYVFALVGRGPQRVAQSEAVTSDILLAADRIVSAMGKYSVPPTMAPIQIPAVFVPESPVDTVLVVADNMPLGVTQSIADVGQLAQQQYEAERKQLLLRAVVRRVVKKSSVALGKDALGIDDPAMQLIADIAGSVWEATEKPDLRCWDLLPRDIQVLRTELPAGCHDIRLQSFGRGSPLQLTPVSQAVEIEDGRNTYVLAFAPTDHVITAPCSKGPRVVVSERLGVKTQQRPGPGNAGLFQR